jgi:hypothetical protein
MQWWAGIHKNVSFKAIQIHNFWEKNQIKRYNFVLQNFCHLWSDKKTKQKISCTDEAIKLVKFRAIKRHFCLYKHVFLAMKRYNRFRNLFFEAMQRYNIRRYKRFTDEATQSPSILENVSITVILQGGSDISETISKLYCFIKKIYF